MGVKKAKMQKKGSPIPPKYSNFYGTYLRRYLSVKNKSKLKGSTILHVPYTMYIVRILSYRLIVEAKIKLPYVL